MKYKDVVCSNSNVTEAWALLLGNPDIYNPNEIGVIASRAKKAISNLEATPTLSMVPQESSNKKIQPFWTFQSSYLKNNYDYTVRFGHRYLSVHFIKANNTYPGYRHSLKDEINQWIEILQNSLEDVTKSQISQIQFGYINRFELELENFELSDYFNMTYGIDLGTIRGDLMNLNISFALADNVRGILYNVCVRIDSVIGNKILLISEIYGTKALKDSILITSASDIINEIEQVKNYTKELFFELLTEKSKNKMGVDNVTVKKPEPKSSKASAKKK